MGNKSQSIIFYITIYKCYINYIMFLKFEVNFKFNLFDLGPFLFVKKVKTFIN